MEKKTIVFAYGAFGCAGIEALQAAGYRVGVVYTHAEEDAGAGESVADLCKRLDLPMYIFEGHETEELTRMRGFGPEFIFSFHYRALLPENVLEMASRGAFNLHPSLLPKYRGRAPLNWVLVNGEKETGVSLHHMVRRADAGDIVAQAWVAITYEDNAATLQKKLLAAAKGLLAEALPKIAQGMAERWAQDLSKGQYFGRRTPEDGRIDWGRQAEVLRNLVRAVTKPFPGAFAQAGGRKMIVWETAVVEGMGVPGEVLSVSPFVIACGLGALQVIWGQLDDGKVMAGVDIAKALHLRAGGRLGEAVVGLRIDVDTMRGMRYGVPSLVAVLEEYGVKATFFMSVGPDNMGRHAWRLLKPRFLWKMMRSKAVSLYGWQVLFSGLLWPGRKIGKEYGHCIRCARDAGHEVGLHAWDHYSWQMHVGRFTRAQALRHMQQGFYALSDILGRPPKASAVPGWRCTDAVLRAQGVFGFSYHSDCRGSSPFVAVVEGKRLGLQLPVTMPTYDEIIGQKGVTQANYNEHILRLCRAGGYAVYTIHAEVEGMSQKAMFAALLAEAAAQDIRFVPLEALARGMDVEHMPGAVIAREAMAGRDGWVAVQGEWASARVPGQKKGPA